MVQRLSSIGDIIQSTSPLNSIRKRFPKAQIDFMVLSQFAPIIENHYAINRIIKINKNESPFTLLAMGRIIDEHYDLVIDLHNSLRTKFMRLVVAKEKSIVYKKPRWRRFKLIQFHQNNFEKDFDQRKLFHQCIEHLFEQHYSIPDTTLNLDEKELLSAQQFLKKLGISENFILIIPGAAWPNKIWLKNHYKSLINTLIKEYTFPIVILGSSKDKICDEIAIQSERVFNLKGKTDLRNSLAIIANSKLVIGSDTGLVHSAEALHIPTIMIMGPTSKETGGGTYSKTSVTMENNNLWCRPCSQNGSQPCFRKVQYCLQSITPEMMTQNLQRFI